jgi:hypothetical protein
MAADEKKKKLQIIPGKLSGKEAKFNEDEAIEVIFNPTEYSTDKKNVFSEATIPGLGSPIIQFSHGAATTLSLELLIDTYEKGKGKSRKDLKKEYIEKFEKLVKVDGELHAPPPCKVHWGDLEFIGVLESLRKNYILFLDDGKPVRAKLTFSFKEYIPVKIQVKDSPFSSPDKTKKFLVKEGDSIWQISYIAYGDPKYWRVIAEENNIDDPRCLEPGKEITIPPLREEGE